MLLYEVSHRPLIESHFCSLSQGLCPIRDVPSTGNHDDPLSYFQIGDLIRGTFRGVMMLSDHNSIHFIILASRVDSVLLLIIKWYMMLPSCRSASVPTHVSPCTVVVSRTDP